MISLITDLSNTRYCTSSQRYSYATLYKQWPAQDRLLKWVHGEVLEDSLLCLQYCRRFKVEGPVKALLKTCEFVAKILSGFSQI
jgi:hypothetical protein